MIPFAGAYWKCHLYWQNRLHHLILEDLKWQMVTISQAEDVFLGSWRQMLFGGWLCFRDITVTSSDCSLTEHQWLFFFFLKLFALFIKTLLPLSTLCAIWILQNNPGAQCYKVKTHIGCLPMLSHGVWNFGKRCRVNNCLQSSHLGYFWWNNVPIDVSLVSQIAFETKAT